VDEARWETPERGARAQLVAGSATAGASVTSVLLRHASAGHRLDWEHDDHLRPLDARGRRQSADLVEVLRPFGVRRLVSSPYVSCVQTVEPLAAALGLEVEQDNRLKEGAGGAAADLPSEDGVVCCTHGDIVEALLGRGLKKGAAVVLDGGAVVREIPPPKYLGLCRERVERREHGALTNAAAADVQRHAEPALHLGEQDDPGREDLGARTIDAVAAGDF